MNIFKFLWRLLIAIITFGYLYHKFSKKKALKLEQNYQNSTDEKH